MKVAKGNRSGMFLLIGLLVFFILPLLLPMSGIYYRVIGLAFLYAALAFAWNLHALTGAISLGHAAFFGLGAYGSALLNHYTSLSPYLSIWMGGLMGAGYGVLWCIVFGKLRGPSFALASLASIQIPKVVIDNWDSFTFGSLGLAGIESFPHLHVGSVDIAAGESLRAQYYLMLILMSAAALIHAHAMQSRLGWAVQAVRQDETAAAALGIDVRRVRTVMLVLSSFLTGICGGVYAHVIGLIEPSLVFSIHISALPLILSIFGGRYQIYGPLVGAMILYPLDQLVFNALVPVGHAILYGLVIITTMLFFPKGIGAWLERCEKYAWN